MTRPTYVTAPLSGPDVAVLVVKTAQATNSAIAGKLNILKDITLTPSSTTTVITDALIGPFSWLGFMPKSANAAAAFAGLYVSSLGKGVATLNHASSVNDDQVFVLAIIG